jgi:hypothetical protein
MGNNIITVHVRNNNTATLICPHCGEVRHINADTFQQGRHLMTVRCRCQQTYTILLNFRRHFRKPTSLQGTYQIVSNGVVGGGIIEIKNISRGGLGFSVSGLHQIEKGQELEIVFQLDDKNKTVLKRRVIVKSVTQNCIGCQFIADREMEKDLGFYLRD